MLVEAAWQAARTLGPLRAFAARVGALRGNQIAAVATARKLATLVWHLLTHDEDYASAAPHSSARSCSVSSRAAARRR